MDTFVADSIFIDASPAEVFRAMVEPSELARWSEAESVEGPDDPAVGSRYVFHRDDGSVTSGEVVGLEPPYRLTIGDFYWERGSQRRGPMTVTWLLEDHDGGVWLTVRQDDLDGERGWKDFATSTRAEWVRATVALKRHVEGI